MSLEHSQSCETSLTARLPTDQRLSVVRWNLDQSETSPSECHLAKRKQQKWVDGELVLIMLRLRQCGLMEGWNLGFPFSLPSCDCLQCLTSTMGPRLRTGSFGKNLDGWACVQLPGQSVLPETSNGVPRFPSLQPQVCSRARLPPHFSQGCSELMGRGPSCH